MKLPRSLSGRELAKALQILGDVAEHLGVTREELTKRLFGAD